MGLETLVIAAPFIWIAAVITASILYRLKVGKPIFPRAPKNAAFSEAWVSGRSLKNMLTRMGGARNCLLIYVADGMLTVVPVFPFNLMFLSEIFGLEIAAPTRKIGIESADSLFGKRIRISVEGPIQERMELSLRDPIGFQQAVAVKNTAGTTEIRATGVGERKRGWRFNFFRGFAILWGSVVLVTMTGELKTDFEFRREGIVATATMVGHTGER